MVGQQTPPRVPAVAAISGTVTDADGKPLAGVQVRVLRRLMSNGEAVVLPTASATTDQSGGYRLAGLGEDDYLVVVLALAFEGPITARRLPASIPGPSGSLGYVATYFPGTTAQSAATIITINGADRPGVDIKLTRVPLTEVTGTIEGANNRSPIPVNLLPARPTDQLSGLNVQRVQIDGSGAFAFHDVLPGAYRLTTSTTTGWVDVPVDASIGAAPLRLTLHPSFIATGRVEFHGAQPAPTGPDLASYRVQLNPQVQQTGAITTLSSVRPDGTFMLRVPAPGRYSLQIVGPPPWIQESGVIAGRDTLDVPVEINEDVTNATVTLVDRDTSIIGAVRDANGALVQLSTVILFPADATQWRSARRVRVIQAFGGSFTATGLMPGRYVAVGLRGNERDPLITAEFLERLSTRAPAFDLASGDHRSVPVRLDDENGLTIVRTTGGQPGLVSVRPPINPGPPSARGTVAPGRGAPAGAPPLPPPAGQRIDNGALVSATPPRSGTSAIRGRIIDPRGPVRGVAVRALLVGAAATDPSATTVGRMTDMDGHYEIGGLSAGRYMVAAALTGFGTLPIGAMSANAEPIHPGQDRPPAGITYITDPDGRFMLMNALQAAPPRGGQPWAYGPSYFRGSSSTSVYAVEVPPNGAREGIDITLEARPAANVFGTVTGPRGAVEDAVMRMTDTASGSSVFASAGFGGQFAFLVVPTGTYTLTATRRLPRPSRAVVRIDGFPQVFQSDVIRGDPEDLVAEMRVVVDPHDVTGLAVTVRPGPQARPGTPIIPVDSPAPPFTAVHGSATLEVLVQDDSDTPVAGARVAIFSASLAGTRAAMSDEAGRVVFRNLPDVDVRLLATAPWGVTIEHGQTSGAPPTSVQLAGGQTTRVALHIRR